MGKIVSIAMAVLCGVIVPGGFHVGPLDRLPPEAYLDPVDQEIARTGVGKPGRPFPCAREVKFSDTTVVESGSTDRCVRMEQSRLWRGLWRNEFEGQRFCPEPVAGCSDAAQGERIWFTQGAFIGEEGAVYEVTFIGRRTQYRGTYGHLGMSDHEVIVDRPLSIRLVEGPPSP
ncbi:hypothetical protein [uncultured Sphingomonas sp.]|uniref:hypothetical protein n=1 Tax=uncultured Sphingomonas sp. TaxID=158754 RepID=UPI0025EF4F80|nr:hypothetical protein [uncultured Sphingomonas sp.]